MSHGGTERTEVKPILQRCRRHKERRRCSVQIPYNFWINCLCIESLIELANILRRSMHRRCLCDFHCFVLIILRPLFFSVWHFLRNLTLSSKPYHFKIQKTLICALCIYRKLYYSLKKAQIKSYEKAKTEYLWAYRSIKKSILSYRNRTERNKTQIFGTSSLFIYLCES